MRECTSKEKYLNAEQQDETLALGRLDTGSHQHKTLSYAITEENCTQKLDNSRTQKPEFQA
jgi:hypothetical protein